MFKNIVIVLFCPPAVKDEQSANRQQQPPSKFQNKAEYMIITLLGKVYPSPITNCWDYCHFLDVLGPQMTSNILKIVNSKQECQLIVRSRMINMILTIPL